MNARRLLIQRYPELRVVNKNEAVYRKVRLVYNSSKAHYSVMNLIVGEEKKHSSNTCNDFKSTKREIVTTLQEKKACNTSSVSKANKEETTSLQPILMPLKKENTYSLGEILSMEPVSSHFLLDELIPRKSLSMLGGKSDVGKSLFYTQLALSIALKEKSFCGFELNINTGSVLIIATEDGPEILRERIIKQLNGRKVPPELDNSLTLVSYSFDAIEVIKENLINGSYDLIVVDAFSDVFQGNMNAANDVRIFMNKVLELIAGHDCAVLFVHHVGKTNSKNGSDKASLLGSVGIEGKCRSAFILSKLASDPNTRVLTVAKGNYVSEEVKGKTYFLSLDPLTLIYKAIEHEIPQDQSVVVKHTKRKVYPLKTKRGRKGPTEHEYEFAFKLREEGKTLKEISLETGKHISTLSKWFKKPAQYDTRKVGYVG